jgi:hypothetical protein
MATVVDFDALMNQPLFGWDSLSLLGDVEDFLDFSEANIDWQLRREIRRVQAEHATLRLEDPVTEAQYKAQELESVEYRFTVSLAQRVRYSGLTSLITSIEWSLLVLRDRASFNIPAKPPKVNLAVHLLGVYANAAGHNLQEEVQLLELLIQVRNCVVHSAGRIATYEYASDLRTRLLGFSGIKLSTANFLGEGVEIEAGFLQGVLERAKVWLPALEKAMYEAALLRK